MTSDAKTKTKEKTVSVHARHTGARAATSRSLNVCTTKERSLDFREYWWYSPPPPPPSPPQGGGRQGGLVVPPPPPIHVDDGEGGASSSRFQILWVCRAALTSPGSRQADAGMPPKMHPCLREFRHSLSRLSTESLLQVTPHTERASPVRAPVPASEHQGPSRGRWGQRRP